MRAQAGVVQSPFTEADDDYRGLVGYLNSGEAQAMTHSDLERELEKKGLRGFVWVKSDGGIV